MLLNRGFRLSEPLYRQVLGGREGIVIPRLSKLHPNVDLISVTGVFDLLNDQPGQPSFFYVDDCLP